MIKRIVPLALGLTLIIIALVWHPAGALTLSGGRDCDANAVIRCGALNFNELSTRYQNSGVSDIYGFFGITAQDINNISGVAVAGVVTNKNNVWINRSSGLCPSIDQSSLSSQDQQAIQNNPNLCLVATNAMTAGRQFIAGSTTVTQAGTTFYTRPPSVSFVSSSLSAFVVMNNKQFAYGIIASCGNPVTATAVKPKPVSPSPITPVKPSSPPAQPQTQTQTHSQTQSQTQTVNVLGATTSTPSKPMAKPAPATNLPNTGPGDVIGFGGITTVFGTIGHFIYSRRRAR